MENRELGMDDYLAMLRRRMKVILIPALLAPLAGFLVSYVFPAKYTSQSLVLVEAPKIPDVVVQQVFTEDLTQHITTIEQRVLSPARLRPMVDRLGLAKGGQSVEDVVTGIQSQAPTLIQPVVTEMAQIGAGGKKKPGGNPVPGFYVNYTASTAREAQQICTDLTSMLLEEDLKSRQDASQGTTDFLTKQVADAKQSLDDMDKKLAAFKNQHMGQLPGDEDSNMKILGGLNSQLDANTQNLNRATQDKSYTESLLAQQLAAWKTSQSSSNPQTLQTQLSQLQAQLIDLQARYTDDHPDVIKTKADIDQVRKKLAEINDASTKGGDVANDKGSGTEPPEIRQLRLQIHQYQDLIAQATRDQKKLQQEIGVYQNRVASSPTIEGEYKELARDYDNAQKVYQEDLAKQSTSKMATQAQQQQQGEQMALLDPATLPDSPSFPNRLLFAGGGLGAGLALGFGLALWLELRDKSIRTQADAETALDLPMLVAVPWVVQTVTENGNGKGHFWNRKKRPEEQKEPARV
ncbi:MAG TPA: Wzz/FepE/Etk N-terminal domain-containing protein [Candidatus Acidoferrum sp.]|jgi:polysaccharide chain length determinant protein (PEP-CTERM system associated)|nr:Wzz/FepE/Etk N-terminal domain-containing protein [Candidatus Acidoferrum sp.]